MAEYITRDEVEEMKTEIVKASVQIGIGVLAVIAVINFVLLQVYFSEKAHAETQQNSRDVAQEKLIREQTMKDIELTQRMIDMTEIVDIKQDATDDKVQFIIEKLDAIEDENRAEMKELEKRLREIERKVPQ